MNKPVDIYMHMYTYLYMHIPRRLFITEFNRKERGPW